MVEPMKIRVMGICWYLKKDYPRILEIMADAYVLQSTYAGWKQMAKMAERKLQTQGYVVVRAMIDPDDFPAWCHAHGVKPDAKGRNLYAADVARRKTC
jgi:hypothetical protein